MQTAHLHLIKYSLAKNLTISVWDGEEWQVKNSTSYKDIKDAVDSVEESELRIKENGKEIGWALIIDQGQPDETVSDYTCTPFMKEWDKAYDAINA
tara:strand:- start:685 stop:972 length:288 start_codon:yes stop_codon:yes gene_type:complete